MRVAVTGATGFIGHYLVRHLADLGHSLRCWYRPASDRSGLATADAVEWVPGTLNDPEAAVDLVTGCDAVVHAALDRPGSRFIGGEGDLIEFAQRNVIGTLRLIAAARDAGVSRFVFLSTCAVHDRILNDRPLDEAHPLWPHSHYGAHKAAIEKFVHSYGLGDGYPICALRPTGVYGAAYPIKQSKWYDLVANVVHGRTVECRGGGKEVHAADVARAAGILLTADGIAGESFNCYDRYISQYEVAMLAQELSGSSSQIKGQASQPQHQIETGKLRSKGMEFGGAALLRRTIEELVEAARQAKPGGQPRAT